MIICTVLSFKLSAQNIIDAIDKYDTTYVKNYLNKGGDIDAIFEEKVWISTRKKSKVKYTLFEKCISAIENSKEELKTENTIKAYHNLYLFLAKIDRSKNKQKQLDRLFTLSIAIGDVELSRKIHGMGADINYKCLVCYGRTPVLIAVGHNDNIEMIKFILSLKPDLSIKDNDGKGFLHFAAQTGSFEMVKYFIDNNLGDINETDGLKNSALMYAAEKGDYKIFNYLIEHGAKMDIVGKKGKTILHAAAESNKIEFFRHVHYISGLPLWTKKKDVIQYCNKDSKEGNQIYLYIVRYTIENFGIKFYKKNKRKIF